MGNPQCVVLGPLPDACAFRRGSVRRWRRTAMFPAGTNVEFAHVEAPDRVRILIWERGVGPTTSSGHRDRRRRRWPPRRTAAPRASVDVVAPGGTQRVEWLDDGVYLTGWADVVLDGQWTGADGLCGRCTTRVSGRDLLAGRGAVQRAAADDRAVPRRRPC